ncbi:MAG: 4-hydroxy-tetrahydrodipicolinate synthase [Gammaproteobacteria bacterium RIFCSPLOWO2_02_FULL_61_13]|nr:MAG: 4-hydroxy-tetrahydrodipicolinate synthase [Gammaproteobacteria bacterium RIFCSPLOWO2_02_FULL_61_13]
MAKHPFHGSITPLPTPFTDGGRKIDLAALKRLVEFQISNGSHGLSCTGTTGEPTSLTLDERKLVIRTVLEANAGRLPFLAGTGSNNTEESIELSRYAKEIGAQGVLIVAPYHVRPSQQGLFEHFCIIARAVGDLPMMLYNIPGRAGVNIEPETQKRIRQACPNVFGVKEANVNYAQVSFDIHAAGRDWAVFSGIEILCYPMLAVGGAGHVSATGNVAPKEVAELYNLVRAGRWNEAIDLHYHLLDLNEVLFIETNPGPVKFLLGQMGLMEPTLRLPLVQPGEQNQGKIIQVAKDYGIL